MCILTYNLVIPSYISGISSTKYKKTRKQKKLDIHFCSQRKTIPSLIVNDHYPTTHTKCEKMEITKINKC